VTARRWVLISMLLSSVPAAADPGAVGLFGGMWGLRHNEPHEVAVQVEYRLGVHWWWLRPLGGMLLSSEGTQLLYAGLLLEIRLPWGIVLAPGLAPGVRLVEGKRDLGSVILFKSSFEVSFPIVPGLRGGLNFSHTSNAKLGTPNPGIETLLMGFEIELK
jgi:Lipid A 3-O-deacylase (PagL)